MTRKTRKRSIQEQANASWECLMMVREVLAHFLGEPVTAPMFYPEAIRHLVFIVARGDLVQQLSDRDFLVLLGHVQQEVARRQLVTVSTQDQHL